MVRLNFAFAFSFAQGDSAAAQQQLIDVLAQHTNSRNSLSVSAHTSVNAFLGAVQ